MPERTASGYRLYDERSIDRVRRMRELVKAGWAPSQAAQAILANPDEVTHEVVAAPAVRSASATGASADRAIADFVAAATLLDETAMERILADEFAALGVDEALERFVLPAMVAVGEAWSSGELDVAAEHAATNTVMRRLAALYEAAGQSLAGPGKRIDVVVGLPPGGRHEVGALAFAIACRRAGLNVRYLGPDVPLESWLTVARDRPGAALVLGSVTPAEARAASEVASAVLADDPRAVVAVGGRAAVDVQTPGTIVLGGDLPNAVSELTDVRSRGAR